MTSEITLTPHQAYRAMVAFLDRYREWVLAVGELGSLAGSMSLIGDGRPADAAMGFDWERAVAAVLEADTAGGGQTAHAPSGDALEDTTLSSSQAYRAAVHFVGGYYEHTNETGVEPFLGAVRTLEGGRPASSDLRLDWDEAITAVRENREQSALVLGPVDRP